MSNVIECRSLTKKFGNLRAVDKINIKIEEDKIYGLIGKNGAGKTTLLHLLTGQYLKNEGEVKVNGEEVFENYNALEKICFAKEKEHAMKDKKVKVILETAEIFYKNWDNDFMKELIKEFELDINKRYKNLSRGMKTSVSNIIGLASRSPITIFDEPSLGLDAAMRDKFYNILLRDYQENKRTIILSTHLIDEVSNLLEEVIIMDKGKILLKEDVEELTQKAHYISGNEKLLQDFIQGKNVLSKEIFGNTSIIAILNKLTEEDINELKRLNADVSKISLQKLFIYLTKNDMGREQ